LLIGRDRLGVKPLYVLHDWQRLAFASEAKALLALPGISAELDREVLAGYLHLGYVAAPGCIFKGIRKLPPATLLAVEAGQVREWRYWRLPDRCTPGVSESEWCDRVRVQLDESVRMQMVSDVPIGAFPVRGRRFECRRRPDGPPFGATDPDLRHRFCRRRGRGPVQRAALRAPGG
jgi:asparagine synthase (glutamine-hydrolysing)